ncbi:MAG: TonB-dependent receptor [Candidatus Sulfotelmatobacter sp.]
MNSRKFRTMVLSLSFLVLAFCISAYSQSTYGSIAGSVTDASGAAVTDANVTLTNMGTAEKRTQTSGNDGLFTFVNLFPGQYRVDVEKQGYKHFTRSGIAVDVQQSTRIDAALQVGEISQVVEVTSETPLLQAETSSLGTVVDQREANELPLNGRNIFNLTTVTPSVVPQGNTQGNVVGKNPFDFANYQIGGAFANEGAEYLDGQPLNIGYINLPFLVPTDDSVGEFKVQNNNLGPEWGKFAGGVINMSTKSGTNSWHGSGYEFLRNKIFNSNEFFNKNSELANGVSNSPPPFTQNQFGATVGGAIIKNKTFVFGSYEGFRLRTGTPFNTTVPTTAERGGDFSDLCSKGFNTPDPHGSGVMICSDTNPSTGEFVHQLYNPIAFTGPVPATSFRVPFANNDISGVINPTSSYLLNKLIADPTTGGTVLNFLKDASTGGDTDEYVARVDQTINSRQTIFGRFSYWKLLSLAQDPFGTGLCKDRCAENTRSKSLAVGYNFAISPNTIFNFNASISRFHYLRAPINDDFDVTQEGWPAAYNPLVPSLERTPLTPCFGQNDSLVGCSQGQSSINDLNTQFNLSPQVTMIRGHHTFVWGAQLEEGYDNYLQTNTGGGLISFAGSWTSNAPGAVGAGNVQGPNAGNGEDFADFLLGYGNGQGAAFGNQTSGSLVISGPISGKQTYRAFYFGDTWHLTTRLTLNLGVRYELQGPWSERYDKMTYFNPGVANSSVTGCSGVAGSACPGDVFLVKTGVNSSRNNLPLSYKEVLPRLGFAYSANSKTVIRGGYGIFFIPNYVSFNANPYNDIVSSATSNFFSSNNQGVTPAASLNANTCTWMGNNVLNCLGAGPFNQGQGGAGANDLTPVAGRNPQPNISQYALTQNNFSTTGYTVQKYGYLEQYNLDIQRELPGGFFADVAYAGSHGVHLEQSNTNINQIPDSFIAQAATQYAAGQTIAIAQHVCPPAPAACPAYPFSQSLPGSLGPSGLIQGQLDRPYPQYSGLNLNAYGCCSSNYNALQATVTRRFQGGGTLLVAYTNAKLMSNTDTLTSWLEGGTTGGTGAVQDWNNLAGERSLSSQDISQRMVVSYVLDLPFGRGKKFLSGTNGLAGGFVSGWGLDGITTFQRGFPVKLSWGGGNALTSAGLGIGTLRPDYVAGCDKSVSGSSVSRVTEWFNTSCFTAPSGIDMATGLQNNPWTFGDEPRVDASLRQQGVVNFDFAVFKKTAITEAMNIEFRVEFFNLFNHPQFGPPNGTQNSPTFAEVTNTVNNPRLIQFGLKFNF